MNDNGTCKFNTANAKAPPFDAFLSLFCLLPVFTVCLLKAILLSLHLILGTSYSLGCLSEDPEFDPQTDVCLCVDLSIQ